jgi:hypothetical protein
MFEINNQWYEVGNRTLNNLNVCANNITDLGIKHVYDALIEQENTAEQAPEGLLGLFRVNLSVQTIISS